MVNQIHKSLVISNITKHRAHYQNSSFFFTA